MQWRAPSGQHGLRCTFAGQQQGLLFEKAGSNPMVHKIAELPQQVVCTCRQEVADRLSALAQADSVRTQELSARQDALERSLREVGASCLSHNLHKGMSSHRGLGSVSRCQCSSKWLLGPAQAFKPCSCHGLHGSPAPARLVCSYIAGWFVKLRQEA